MVPRHGRRSKNTPVRSARPVILDAQVHYGANSDGTYCPVTEALAVSAAEGVDQIVQVTAAAVGWDNGESLKDAADHPGRVLGVIGRFDALSPNVEARLKELQALPGILGIRLASQTSGAPDGLRDGTFDPLFAATEKLDVAIQIFAPFQVPEIHDMARRFPGVRILLDHLGVTRGFGRETFRQWPQLCKLGEEPNVWIKVSYFPDTVYTFEDYPYPTAQRYFRELYQHVGSSKLVWASNYPPVKRACSYREALDFVRVHCDFLSLSDKDAILGGNFLAHFGPK
jgi:predicted TIM-barrel fold metal-dependent hydrolase